MAQLYFEQFKLTILLIIIVTLIETNAIMDRFLILLVLINSQ